MLKQADVGVDVVDTRADVVGDGVELVLKGRTLASDVAKSCSDPGGIDLGVGGKVKEVLFLNSESGDLPLNLFLQLVACTGLVFECALEAVTNGCNELGAKGDRLVVLLHGDLDSIVGGVGRVTRVILNPAAEEVLVGDAVGTWDFHLNHPSIDLVLQPAPTTPQGSLQVVVVFALPLARVPARVHECLHPLEDLVLDEAGVPSFVPLSLVADFSEVVAVAQESVDF
ncbi:MAG: hypothetical protein ACKVOG_06185 [Rhodoglobus sp.]